MESSDERFALIAGSELYAGNLTIRQPTLDDIRKIGYWRYRSYLSSLMIDKDVLKDVLGDEFKQILDEVSVFQIVGYIEELRSVFLEALSFFVVEPLFWNGECFASEDCILSDNDLDAVKKMICKLSYISIKEKEKPPEFKSKKAKEIYEKLQKGRAALEKAKGVNANMELSNLIGAVSGRHAGYNLFNIWGLTVYQLYDQFSRIDTNVQLGIYGQRWAAWGEDKFDTTVWYHATNN